MPGVGIDVVDLVRIAESIERAPGRLAARLCTEAELAWIAEKDEVERLAACFALKEAWIKAQGGRPAGFRWQDCEFNGRGHFAGIPSMWVAHKGVVTARVGDGRATHMTNVPIDVAPDGLTERELAY
jgi:phosphopantetheinyl transferase (holo-ACP synthase)